MEGVLGDEKQVFEGDAALDRETVKVQECGGGFGAGGNPCSCLNLFLEHVQGFAWNH